MEHDLVLEIPTDVRSIEHAVDYVMERCRAEYPPFMQAGEKHVSACWRLA